MKTKTLILSALPLAIALVSLTAYNPGRDLDDSIKGVYKSVSDFNKGNLCTDYDHFTRIMPKNERFFLEKGEEEKVRSGIHYVEKGAKGITAKESGFYGYQDKQGLPWRLVERQPHFLTEYRVIEKGKICFYTSGSVSVTTDDKGAINNIECQTDTKDHYYDEDGKWSERPATTEFFYLFYISTGADGKLYPCNEKNLENLMADDADIAAKVNKKGIYELRVNKWNESFNDVRSWVSEYNSKHQ